MADITERIVIPEVPRVLDGQELYVYIPERKVNSYTKEETDALLATKFDKSNVAQTTGDSADKVMSQKAAMDSFAHLVNGKVPESQLPSYVDDVVEYDSKDAFPATGETGKIYVDKSTNLTYRWSGSTYIQVGGGDLNLENGTGTGSLVQKRLKSDGVTWTTAKAYQGASTALGGGTQAGRTKEEFNAYFWDSTNNIPLNGGKGKDSQGNILDSNGLTYAKSYSYALAEGESTKALGRSSHAEGNETQSIGNHSHAEGLITKAEGYAAHTEGAYTEAYYTGSHAEGNHTKTYAPYQHVGGTYNHYNINALYQVGNGTSDNDRKNAFEVLKDGRAKVQSAPIDDNDVVRKIELDNSWNKFNLENGTGVKSIEQVINNGTTTTIPISTKNPNAVTLGAPASVNVGAVGESTSSFGGASNATGKRSHAEGTNTVAIGKYSHAEGDNSVALGNDSHAEGITTVAKGRASHSEGSTTQSIGDHSHAEGSETISSGYSSHSEGGNTQASGLTAHAEGSNTIASGATSHAEGSSTQATIDQAHAEGLETKASGIASHSEGVSSTSEGDYSHAEGYKSTTKKTAYTPPSGTESGSGITGDAGDTGSSWNIEQHRGEGAHSEGILTQSSGYSSHSEGVRTVADGHYSHAEGQLTYAKGSSSHAEGLQTNAEGISSHAEGSITKAIGHSSHAEGYETTASIRFSHAEGYGTTASGDSSHAEGISTIASGNNSHSEGIYTEAKHEASHAEGAYTRTSRAIQHVGGKYNADNSNALLIIGNGDSDSNRKNAFEVLADGTIRVPNFDSNGNRIGMATLKVINGVLTVIA